MADKPSSIVEDFKDDEATQLRTLLDELVLYRKTLGWSGTRSVFTEAGQQAALCDAWAGLMAQSFVVFDALPPALPPNPTSMAKAEMFAEFCREVFMAGALLGHKAACTGVSPKQAS